MGVRGHAGEPQALHRDDPDGPLLDAARTSPTRASTSRPTRRASSPACASRSTAVAASDASGTTRRRLRRDARPRKMPATTRSRPETTWPHPFHSTATARRSRRPRSRSRPIARWAGGSCRSSPCATSSRTSTASTSASRSCRCSTDLKFSDTVYGLGAGIFFIGYFLFEVPSNVILHRVGARVWIARIMISWGVLSALMMFVSSPTMFYLVRFLLGVAEAGFFPGIILYLTYWYPAHRRARMTALFMTAVALSGVIGGPLSGWILKDARRRERLGRLAVDVPDRRHPVDRRRHRRAVLPRRPHRARALAVARREGRARPQHRRRQRGEDRGIGRPHARVRPRVG